MIPLSQELEWIHTTFTTGKKLGVSQVNIDNHVFDGKHVKVKGKDLLFWGNCSYLGLDTDDRLKQAAIDGIQRYGTFFASSRAFIGLHQYEYLEELIALMFQRPCVVTQTTAMGSSSVLPLLISDRDLIILDQQVHHTVSSAAMMCKAKGTTIEVIRHNRMDLLEEKIKSSKDKYRHIWYLVDGVYSMYGDAAPMQKIYALLDTYDSFYTFVDDAHGMSWTGVRGTGYALSQAPMHDKMVYILSLSKSFSSGGAAIVLPNEKWKSIVKNCAGALVFSGPLTPGSLFAGIRSAYLHLSEDLIPLQEKLHGLIHYFIQQADQYQIELMDRTPTPVFYVRGGSIEKGIDFGQYMLAQGHFVNVCAYPSVPKNNTGIRMTVTNHMDQEDIDNLLEAIAGYFEGNQKEGLKIKKMIGADF